MPGHVRSCMCGLKRGKGGGETKEGEERPRLFEITCTGTIAGCLIAPHVAQAQNFCSLSCINIACDHPCEGICYSAERSRDPTHLHHPLPLTPSRTHLPLPFPLSHIPLPLQLAQSSTYQRVPDEECAGIVTLYNPLPPPLPLPRPLPQNPVRLGNPHPRIPYGTKSSMVLKNGCGAERDGSGAVNEGTCLTTWIPRGPDHLWYYKMAAGPRGTAPGPSMKVQG
jgi:hypothetical protein